MSKVKLVSCNSTRLRDNGLLISMISVNGTELEFGHSQSLESQTFYGGFFLQFTKISSHENNWFYGILVTRFAWQSQMHSFIRRGEVVNCSALLP